MSVSYADFPDLKLFRLIKSETHVAPIGASIYTKTFRSDRIILLIELKIQFSVNGSAIADGILLDDQPINDIILGPNNTNVLFNQINAGINVANAFCSGLLFPLRETIKIRFNNAGVGNENQIINAWGYVAEVSAEDFQGRASLQQI